MKPISNHESPEPAQPFPGPGRAHIDDIEEPEGEEITPQPAPQDGWTVIAEEEIIQRHPHLAAEIVLLVSVIADNSLCDLLTNFVPDCFCSLAHQSIFKAMLSLRARGIAISSSTIEVRCAEAGETGVSEDLSALLFLLPLFAVDQATFYRAPAKPINIALVMPPLLVSEHCSIDPVQFSATCLPRPALQQEKP